MRSLRLLTIVGVVLAVVFAVGSPQSIRAQTCQPRPRVGVVTTTLASGRLQVAVTAGMSAIQSIEFEAGRAVSIEVDGQAHRTPYVDRPAPGMTQRSFTVVRDGGAGTPTHLPFTVTDGCGPWKTFVGGGPQTLESAVRGRVTSAHDNQPVEGATVQI